MHKSEKAKLERLLSRLIDAAIAEGCVTSIGGRLNDIISAFDLDAGMVYANHSERLKRLNKALGRGKSRG